MLRRAWRRLFATPVFTIFAVISLALGVGVTTAIYSVIVFLTKTGLEAPAGDRVAMLVGTDLDGRRLTWRGVVGRADFDDLRRSSGRWAGAAASAPFYQTIVRDAVAESIWGEAVSGTYFPLLGVQPHRGRLVQPSDDAAPARIVVISHQLWETRFGADEAVVGSTLRIGGEPFEIVGVAPDEFSGLTDRVQSSTAVWVPLAAAGMFPSSAAPPDDPADRRRRQLTVLVPAADPRDVDALSAEASAIGARLDAEFPIDMRRATDAAPIRQPRSWQARALTDVAGELEARMIGSRAVVLTVVGLVLVVACTNLANLMLARGSSRVHEIAVRRALGASRTRLLMEELVEALLLAAAGFAGSLLVARVLMIWFSTASIPFAESLIVQLAPVFDTGTWLLAAAAVSGSLIVFGLAPALQLTQTSARTVLNAEAGSTGQLKWRTKRVLIAVQVMISLSFFLIAAFAARIALADRSRPSGIDIEQLAVGTLNFRLPPWNEVRGRDAVDRIMQAGSSDAEVESLAIASGMPFGLTGTPTVSATTPEKPFLPGREGYSRARLLASTPSIFTTLGVQVPRGRAFDSRDNESSGRVAVLSELAAREVFGTADVVGRDVMLRQWSGGVADEATATVTVVGVAADTDTQQRYERRIGVVYVPLAQHYEPSLVLVGRARGDVDRAVPALRAIVRRAHPDLALERADTAPLMLTGAFALIDVVGRVTGGLAILAMLLSMAGLFGVLSHLVARRTREMGLRMALGADASQIHRLVQTDGLRPVGSGLVMGFIIGILVRWLFRLAYHAPLTLGDVLVFILAPLPILLSAIVACYWPARRAARVQPNVALRDL